MSRRGHGWVLRAVSVWVALVRCGAVVVQSHVHPCVRVSLMRVREQGLVGVRNTRVCLCVRVFMNVQMGLG